MLNHITFKSSKELVVRDQKTSSANQVKKIDLYIFLAQETCLPPAKLLIRLPFKLTARYL